MWAPLRHSGAAVAALVAAPGVLALAAARPDWRRGWRERLGHVPRAPDSIWVHGASVGEILAASRLIGALQERGCAVLASTMTGTGRRILRSSCPDVLDAFAPVDHPWCVSWALRRACPRALVLVETELWPSWIAAAERAGVPVMVASGRLSDRGFARYRRMGFLLRPTFERLGAVGARSEDDGRRFAALGVPRHRIRVTGDLKVEPPRRAPELAEDLAAMLSGPAPLVAASTHAGEEELVTTAVEILARAGHELPLVLAPRRPERAAELELSLRARGRSVRRRSSAEVRPVAPGEVLILDSLGELRSLMARALLVFVGGTFSNVGGHNVLEPAAAGLPVLLGPHTENWREASELLLACGAARRVGSAAELAKAIEAWLADPAARRRAGAAARREVERHGGATRRTLALLEELVGRPGGEPA